MATSHFLKFDGTPEESKVQIFIKSLLSSYAFPSPAMDIAAPNLARLVLRYSVDYSRKKNFFVFKIFVFTFSI